MGKSNFPFDVAIFCQDYGNFSIEYKRHANLVVKHLTLPRKNFGCTC